MEKVLHRSNIFKRAISLVLTFVMLLSLIPVMPHVHAAEGDTTVYLKPNANWLADNARFAVYYWNDGGNVWTDMTDADSDGYYEASIPAGYSNIIFCRMNPGTTENSWDNKWNQTADLTVPTDGTNCYTIADDSWDAGSWSTYPAAGEETEETTAPTEQTEPAPAGTYYVAGVAALCGSEWSSNDAANQMTLNDEGLYEKSYSNVGAGTYEFKVTDGTWDNSWGDNGSNYSFTLDAVSNVTILFNADTKAISVNAEAVPTETYIVAGTAALCGSEWAAGDTANQMALNTDGLYEKVYTDVPAGTHEFKITDGTWDNSWGDNGNNYSFTLEAVSTVTITFNAETKVISVAAESTEVEIPEGYTAVRIHFLKPDGWGSTINAYVWTASGALTGYEDYNAWPGKAISANSGHAGWYDLIVATETPTPFNFIFNDGGNQTADLSTGEITGDTELWVVGDTVSTTAPGEWNGEYDYTANIHFQKPADWGETINAYLWDANGALPGYEAYNAWPGSPVEADAINAGWYNVSVTMDEHTGFNFIFNDGSKQTADLTTGTLDVTTNIWVVDGAVVTEQPAGWVDPDRTVHVPGTFPGESWSASSNEMTYDAELGLYVYTFENVPAANYEYKIAINGSWSENYGANGEKDGSNIAVAVPETMDVTVYYNDETHYSVTSVDYKFLDIALSGTGIPEGTKLTDKGLTGIYKATVSLAAGTYSDIQLTVGEEINAFSEFTLEEAKDVTFYYDPASGIYYCDAVPSAIDADKVYYNSQDEAYKAPYGAVATGEEVTFSIETGEEVLEVRLVVTGLNKQTVALEQNGEAADGIQSWTGTATFDTIGECDYYFILSDGNGIKVYGDDDGYYGVGEVTDLDKMTTYDLVVYEAGFETPDWMKNAVIYQIFPDRFFDGDTTNNQAQTWARGEVDYEYITDWYALPENPEQEAMLTEEEYLSSGACLGDGEWSNEIYGGDLQGIIQRIDYLKALGVNVIYLNPVFWSISNHRYDAVDYTEIDPILGTLGDFEELVAVAEANDMHIILDGVFNHVSDDSVYFDRYYKFLGKSEKIGAYPYWAYVYDYMSENGVAQADAEAAAKTYFGENYGITDYSYTEWFAVSSETMAGTVDEIGLRAGKEVYSYEGWWGYDSMPVIYSTNGSEYQTGNWAEEIIGNEEGTAVTQYWISEGSNGWRLDVANEVSDETWQNFRDSVKALDSDAVIIGEIWDDATKYLMGDMYDSVMNYMFRNAVTSYAMGTSAEDTTKAMEKIRERYPEEAFYAMMNLVGSHDTTRILSYLDGIGDDRSDKSFEAAFPTYEGTSDLAKQRQYLVSFLQFTYAGAPTIYYGDEIGMVGADDPDDRRAFEWGKGNQELVEWYATLAAIREAYPALRTGSVEVIDTGDSSLMGYVRADENNTLTVIANNASSDKTIALEGSYVDLISGGTFTGTVPALNGVILVAEDEVKTVTVNTEDLAPAYDDAYIVATEGRDHTTHTPGEAVKENVVEATCTAEGSYDEVVYCSVCGAELSREQKTTDKLDHNFEGGSCTICGADDPNSVPATPVKPSWQSWLDKIFGNWFDKEEEEPTEPSVPETTEPEVTEPEVTEPSVPAEPVKPSKPNLSGIFGWIFGWLK